MFQVDGGRSVAVHPLQPARSRFGAEAPSMVADHLDALLGEHLLPLRIRQGDQDEPYLLAVDAAGQPVVVEVVALLDEEAVMRAVRHAGRAARMSTQDLARAYSGGAEHFAAHLAVFRETVPATSLLSTSVRGGSRLLLVCSDLADGMDDVVEFLLQPGAQIEVLQVGVIPGADGARIVDVSPMTRTPPARRAMEPTSLHLVRSPEVRTPAGRAAAADLTPPRPAQSWPTPAWQTSPTRRPDPTRMVPVTPVAPVVPVRTPALSREAPSALPLVGADDSELTRRMPAVTPPPFAVLRGPITGGAPAASFPDAHAVGPGRGADAAVGSLPYAFTGVAPGPVRSGPDPRLAALAAGRGGPTALVWNRERRGELYEALLHGDGIIELPDGSRHTDPDAAAAAVSSSEHAVDGWRVWRVDNQNGPALMSLV